MKMPLDVTRPPRKCSIAPPFHNKPACFCHPHPHLFHSSQPAQIGDGLCHLRPRKILFSFRAYFYAFFPTTLRKWGAKWWTSGWGGATCGKFGGATETRVKIGYEFENVRFRYFVPNEMSGGWGRRGGSKFHFRVFAVFFLRSRELWGFNFIDFRPPHFKIVGAKFNLLKMVLATAHAARVGEKMGKNCQPLLYSGWPSFSLCPDGGGR